MRALKPGENVRDAVQFALTRLAQRCVQILTREMSHPLTDRDVHEIRTRIKKIRGLTRLVRSDMGDARYERAKKSLRKISRSLASLRDAKVLLTTCEGLLQHRKAADRAALSLRLRRRLNAARLQISPPKRRAMAQKLATLQKVIASWPQSDTGWKALSQGLRHEYGGGRDVFQSPRRAHMDARLHQLRKRSKALHYMCEFLSRVSPYAHSRSRQLSRFAACLGTVHDLSVLINSAPPKHLERIAERKQTAFRKNVWQQGARIYRDSPAAFTKRIHQDWKRRH